jgi:hypothetical protein
MKTSEDARLGGLYASACCGEEQVFCQWETLSRCPRCHQLCAWELVFPSGFFPS